MGLDIVIGMFAGVGALYVGVRRIRYVRAYVRRQRALGNLERTLRAGRALASQQFAYRVPDATDGDAVEELHAATTEHRSGFEACGFSSVGDIVCIGPDNARYAILHALGDATGTTWITIARYAASPKTLTVCMFSYLGDEALTTDLRPVALAMPPFRRSQVASGQLTCAALVAKHRAYIEPDAERLDRVADRAELVARLSAFQVRVAHWRTMQAPDELLDADLRTLLGEHYATQGKHWARRLRDELPTATVRRR